MLDSCSGASMFLAVLASAAGGAAIGAGIDGLMHRVVFEQKPGLAGEFSSEIAVAAGWDTFKWSGVAVNGPAHVSVSLRRVSRTGWGFEVSGARTIGEAARRIECVRADHLPSAPEGSCAGSGEVSIRAHQLGSAKVIYQLPLARVQPYAGIGAAFMSYTDQCPSPTTAVFEARRSGLFRA